MANQYKKNQPPQTVRYQKQMINIKDQEELLRLIADYIEEDLSCIAIGGTAMMFSGYKTTTKDIDLVFKDSKDREIFIKAIIKLGYKEKSLVNVYDEKRIEQKNKPKMFSRGDERFDLFVKDIFGFEINQNIVQQEDFLGNKELNVKIIGKDDLILLKAVTSREKDFEDIETIIKIEKIVNWDYITKEAIKQKDKWFMLDLEETMHKLKKITLIQERYFKILHNNLK
jgi:predicted nucleotidyltransferase